MSRFLDELSGKDGEFWKKHAEEQIKECLVRYEKGEIILESDGAAKWSVNDRYIPDDYCEIMEAAGIAVNREATTEKRDIRDKIFLEEYRARMENHVYSAEELYEMRAAFGDEATVVDVVTGQTTDLSEPDNR